MSYDDAVAQIQTIAEKSGTNPEAYYAALDVYLYATIYMPDILDDRDKMCLLIQRCLTENDISLYAVHQTA